MAEGKVPRVVVCRPGDFPPAEIDTIRRMWSNAFPDHAANWDEFKNNILINAAGREPADTNQLAGQIALLEQIVTRLPIDQIIMTGVYADRLFPNETAGNINALQNLGQNIIRNMSTFISKSIGDRFSADERAEMIIRVLSALPDYLREQILPLLTNHTTDELEVLRQWKALPQGLVDQEIQAAKARESVLAEENRLQISQILQQPFDPRVYLAELKSKLDAIRRQQNTEIFVVVDTEHTIVSMAVVALVGRGDALCAYFQNWRLPQEQQQPDPLLSPFTPDAEGAVVYGSLQARTPDLPNVNGRYISDVCTAEDRQSQGHGSRVMDAIVSKYDADNLALHVRVGRVQQAEDGNPPRGFNPACFFYERFGFRLLKMDAKVFADGKNATMIRPSQANFSEILFDLLTECCTSVLLNNDDFASHALGMAHLRKVSVRLHDLSGGRLKIRDDMAPDLRRLPMIEYTDEGSSIPEGKQAMGLGIPDTPRNTNIMHVIGYRNHQIQGFVRSARGYYGLGVLNPGNEKVTDLSSIQSPARVGKKMFKSRRRSKKYLRRSKRKSRRKSKSKSRRKSKRQSRRRSKRQAHRRSKRQSRRKSKRQSRRRSKRQSHRRSKRHLRSRSKRQSRRT